jgi:hypothetical protein
MSKTYQGKGHLRPPREELYRLFVVEQRFRFHLAARYGVCEDTIRKWLRGYSIPTQLSGRRRKIDVTQQSLRRRAMR